ncbi:MAG TPA: TetR/AcrR family transcriptional regulator [Ktedonobacteraceae bacterium]|nr:TetR/AcrR family transcriptional regulator [Ktedonobacteraceae bacterium]
MPQHKARRDDQQSKRSGAEQQNVRKAILDATEQLLAHQQFDELSVADILIAAQVSRASFYFYFESKYVVLGELVQRVVQQAQAAAGPWIEEDTRPPEQTLRQGTSQGLQLWIKHAPVLRAIVEHWRSDERLAALWTEMMDGFTRAARHRIEHDRATGRAPRTSVDASTLASTLTWMSERIYYLAAIGHTAFQDEQQVIDVLTEVWLSVIYSGPPPQEGSE